MVDMRVTFLVAALVTLACGGNTESGPANVSGSGGSGNVSGSGGSGNVSGSGGIGGKQECSASAPCKAGLFCDWQDNKCGAGSASGVCSPPPSPCTFEYAPVCGCDGQVAATACAAQTAGTDLNDLGGCTPPAGSFACGSIFCTSGQQFCQRWVTDMMGFEDGYLCKPLPSACAPAPSCDCLSSVSCGGASCDSDSGGNLTMTCPTT
jgi:hypothetical protein